MRAEKRALRAGYRIYRQRADWFKSLQKSIRILEGAVEKPVKRFTLDHAAHARGVCQRGALEMPAVQLNIEVAQDTENEGHGRNEQHQQFPAETSRKSHP